MKGQDMATPKKRNDSNGGHESRHHSEADLTTGQLTQLRRYDDPVVEETKTDAERLEDLEAQVQVILAAQDKLAQVREELTHLIVDDAAEEAAKQVVREKLRGRNFITRTSKNAAEAVKSKTKKLRAKAREHAKPILFVTGVLAGASVVNAAKEREQEREAATLDEFDFDPETVYITEE